MQRSDLHSSQLRRSALIAIVLILLLAAATRIINAGHWPVWTDEGWSAWAASDHNLGVILDKVAQDRHPPLYFLSLSAWWTVAGDSRLALRFLGIASGILTVAVVYRIAADWMKPSAAIYAALLTAVADVIIYYSQEIRHYGWLMLAVCLMTLFFLRYLRRPRWRVLVYYTISIVFMLYTLYFGVFTLAVQGGIGLLVWRGSRRYKGYLLAVWILSVLLYIPWLIALSRQLGTLLDGIAGFQTTPDGVFSVLQILFGGQLALTMGLYAVGVGRLIRRPSASMQWLALMTITWSGIGLLSVMTILNLKLNMLSARTLVYLAPMLMLMCGYGLSLIERRTQRTLAVALVSVLLVTTDFVQPRLDYHVAAQALAAEYTPGDLIILETGWDDNAFRYELTLALHDENAPIIRTLIWVGNRYVLRPVVPQVEPDLEAHRRVWVVNWLQPPQVVPFLDKGGDGFSRVLTRETPVGQEYKDQYSDPDIHVILYEKPASTLGTPTTFGNTVALRDLLLPSSVQAGQALHVDSWWSSLVPPPLDYSAGIVLMDGQDNVFAAQDSALGITPTTKWTPGALMFDRHTLNVPATLPPGDYIIGARVYWYGDGKPLTVNGNHNVVDGPYVLIGGVEVK